MMLEEGTYGAIVAFFTFVAAARAMVGPISETLQAAKRRHPDCLLVLSIVGPPEIVRALRGDRLSGVRGPVPRRARRRRAVAVQRGLRAPHVGSSPPAGCDAAAGATDRRVCGETDPRRGRSAGRQGTSVLHRQRGGVGRDRARVPGGAEDRVAGHSAQDGSGRCRTGSRNGGRRRPGLRGRHRTRATGETGRAHHGRACLTHGDRRCRDDPRRAGRPDLRPGRDVRARGHLRGHAEGRGVSCGARSRTTRPIA